MKKLFSKAASLMLILCLAFGMFSFSAANTFATDEDWQIDTETARWVGDESDWLEVYDYLQEDYWLKPATINSVTSSDDKVLKPREGVYYDEDENQIGFWLLQAKKAGKATITVDFTKPDNTSGTLTKTITVRKYPYPIKSLKVNGKTVKVSKHKYHYLKKTSKTKVKVKMATKNGWKIASVYGFKYDKYGNEKEITVKKSTLTKGKLLSFAKKYRDLVITVTMTKGSKRITYYINFYR